MVSLKLQFETYTHYYCIDDIRSSSLRHPVAKKGSRLLVCHTRS